MGKQSRVDRQARRNARIIGNDGPPPEVISDYSPKNQQRLEAKTEGQAQYILAIQNAKIVIGVGPAGTGKTFVAAAVAADKIASKKIDRVVVTRPAIEAGESLGFLPGELDEKFDPFFEPVKEVFERRLGEGHVSGLIKAKRIVAAPLAYMRGRTFNDSFVILDEAQNTTPAQMYLLLTRIGEGTTVVINGDLAQSDLKGPNGLQDVIDKIGHISGVRVVEFDEDDIVRSGIVREIVKAYRKSANVSVR